MALVKYNNNSLSAITAASSLPTGAMTLIKEQTASASGTIDFVDGTSDVVLDSTYPIYLFKYINAHPGTNDQNFTFQGSTDTGSSYGVTMTSTKFRSTHKEDGTYTDLSQLTFQDLAQSTSFHNLHNGVGSVNDEQCSGELWLFSPSSTTFVKNFKARGVQYQADDYPEDDYSAGYFNTTSAIDAIQFKMSSGDIDAGTFKLYGIKDS